MKTKSFKTIARVVLALVSVSVMSCNKTEDNITPSKTQEFIHSNAQIAAQNGYAIPFASANPKTNMAVDLATRDYYVVGALNTPINFGGSIGTLTPILGLPAVYLIKYRFDGTPLWGKALGGAGLTTNPQVEVDKASNVCVSGQFSGSINIPGYTTILSTGGFDGFVSKFNINGNFVSFTHFKGLGDCTFLRMNWDVGSNALFVTFSVSNGVTIVGGYLFNSVTGDCGIVKMTASNLVVTGLKVGSAGSIERIDDIYADQNALYVVGSFTGASTTFANQTITGGSTGINSFAARIKDDLLPTSATWAKLVTKNTTAALQPLTVAAWGNYCYVGGSHDASTQQLVGVAAPTPAGFDGFVMKFGALTAASSFVTSYSSSGSDRVTDLATNSSKLFIGAYTEPSAMMRKLQIEKYDLATGTIANSVFVSPNIAADIHTIRSVATPIAVNSYCYISGVFQTNLTNSSGSINLSQTPPHLNGFLLQDL